MPLRIGLCHLLLLGVLGCSTTSPAPPLVDLGEIDANLPGQPPMEFTGMGGTEIKTFWQRIRISEWPGKNGPMKPGFAFRPGNYPALAGLKVLTNTTSVRWNARVPHVIRNVHVGLRPHPIRITIYVSHRSPADAQEWMFVNMNSLRSSTPMWSDAGLRLGDIAFSEGLSQPDRGVIIFARNNVAVELKNYHHRGINLICFAREMDARIESQPNLTPAEFSARRPAITEFRPERGEIPTHGSVPLNFSYREPEGQRTEVKFKVTWGGVRQGARRWEYFAHFKNEAARIVAVSVTDHLLFDAAEMQIEVK